MSKQKSTLTVTIGTTQIEDVRAFARMENRSVASVVEEALVKLIDTRMRQIPRTSAFKHYKDSLERFGPLYERLTK